MDNNFSARSPEIPPPPPPSGFTSPTTAAPSPKNNNGGCFIAVVVACVLGGVGIAFLCIISLVFLFSTMAGISKKPYPSFEEEFISGDFFSKNKIVLIDVKGIILSEDGSTFQTIASARKICEQLKYLAEDPLVKGVVLDIDSPGGEVVASDIIHHQIMELRNKQKIPVVASMGSLAASGAYYIAASCDYIIANRMTLTGSIGVIIQNYKYFDLLKKVGVQNEVFKSGPMKDILNGARPSNIEEQQIIQSLVENTYNEFVKIVAEGRKGLSVEKIKNSKIGDGRIFDGEEALELKLLDKLGFLEDAILKTAEISNLKKNYQVVRYMDPFSFSKLFKQATGPSRGLSVRLPIGGKRIEIENGKMYFLPQAF